MATVFNASAAANIDSVMRGIIDRGVVPGNALAVGVGGKTVYRAFFGNQTFGGGRPYGPDTLCRMYSMTKPVTVVAAMQLWERGLFSLGDPVSQYIPEFATPVVERPDGAGGWDIVPAQRQITMEHLFTMTSGLPYGGEDASGLAMRRYARYCADQAAAGNRMSTLEVVRGIGQLPLLFEPGDGYRYGMSHDVLGGVIEAISGLSLAEYCEKHIFAPLGMSSSSFRVSKNDERLAQAYTTDAAGRVVPCWDVANSVIDSLVDFENPYYFAGGAGLVSTLDDYFRFTQMLANGGTLDGVRILGKNTVRLIATPRLNPVQRAMYAPPDGDQCAFGASFSYGLGVRVMVEDVHSVSIGTKGEWGWSGALSTWQGIDPANDMCFVYLHQRTNVTHASYIPKIQAAIYAALD